MGQRIGIGYDIHRLVPGRPLMLGGVAIPGALGLLGHSDADVILHALTDALLGALGAPDIGDLFPDDEPRWHNANSRVFLEEAARRTQTAGYCISNVDVIVHAQQPRLGKHKPEIQAALARLLGLPADRVGVKARTNEGLDAIGRGEAIGCWVAVLLEPLPRTP